jgi:hypothetical protein
MVFGGFGFGFGFEAVYEGFGVMWIYSRTEGFSLIFFSQVD